MHIVKKDQGKFFSLPAGALSKEGFKALSSELAQTLVGILAKGPNYPLQLAKQLGVHEQKVYYHIRNLYKAGVIKKYKQELKKGVLTNYYTLTHPSFFVHFEDLKPIQKMVDIETTHKSFLNPFIQDGTLKALIIVGSPYPHGKLKARSKDAHIGMDLALFLGTFLHHVPLSHVKLDINVKSEDLMQNLIVIGGPRVNRITDQLNDTLPIYFHEELDYALFSKKTQQFYSESECGLIVKISNPFDKTKSILVLGGKGSYGTRASILAFLEHFDTLVKNYDSSKSFGCVVEGLDLDSDGIIDAVEFKEYI